MMPSPRRQERDLIPPPTEAPLRLWWSITKSMLAPSGVPGLLLFLGFAAAGLGTIALAGTRLFSTTHPVLQVPYLVSGGITGVALMAAGIGLAVVHVDRLMRTRERAQWLRIIHALRSATAGGQPDRAPAEGGQS